MFADLLRFDTVTFRLLQFRMTTVSVHMVYHNFNTILIEIEFCIQFNRS